MIATSEFEEDGSRPGSAESRTLRGRFPFRLGSTSYVIPEDLIPNARYLSERLEDMEVILFDGEGFSNLPTAEEVETLGRIGRERDLTYTVHLPQDVWLGSPDEAVRRGSLDLCLRVMDLMEPLLPFAWVLHLQGELRGDPPSSDMPGWRERNRRSLEELIARAGDPRSICVETLDYDFDDVADAVEELDLGVCLDIGHLILTGRDIPACLDRWMPRARVFHVHGVRPDGTDHVDLSYLDPAVRDLVLDRLASAPGERAVSMEIFGEEDFARSMAVMGRVAEERMPGAGGKERPRR
jgi:sugar phosphate isomerase/epimerase